jgi:hypothetical protein
MESDLQVIIRRLAEVPSVQGNVSASLDRPAGGPGVSRYQKQSAHLRDRDCSLELTNSDVVDVDLTRD